MKGEAIIRGKIPVAYRHETLEGINDVQFVLQGIYDIDNLSKGINIGVHNVPYSVFNTQIEPYIQWIKVRTTTVPTYPSQT